MALAKAGSVANPNNKKYTGIKKAVKTVADAAAEDAKSEASSGKKESGVKKLLKKSLVDDAKEVVTGSVADKAADDAKKQKNEDKKEPSQGHFKKTRKHLKQLTDIPTMMAASVGKSVEYGILDVGDEKIKAENRKAQAAELAAQIRSDTVSKDSEFGLL